MDLDYKALSFGLQALNTFGLIVVGVYSWISNRHKANASSIEAVKDQVLEDMTKIESRFARVESEIRHLPTHNDMGAVYERVNEVAETLSALQGQLQQMNSGVQMIHQYLLNQNQGKR